MPVRHVSLFAVLALLCVTLVGCGEPSEMGGGGDGHMADSDSGTHTADTGAQPKDPGVSTAPASAASKGDVLTAENFANTEFASTILENDKTVVVDFTATWCGPCKMLKPILHELEDEGDIQVVEVDVDQFPNIAKAFGVQGIPHLVFVKDGTFLETSTGLVAKEKLQTILDGLSP